MDLAAYQKGSCKRDILNFFYNGRAFKMGGGQKACHEGKKVPFLKGKKAIKLEGWRGKALVAR